MSLEEEEWKSFMKKTGKAILLTFILLLSLEVKSSFIHNELSKNSTLRNLFSDNENVSIEKCGIGSTNQVFFLSHKKDGKKYVLIQAKEDHSQVIELNYDDIFHNTVQAGKMGIGPKVLLYERNKKYLVEEFLKGERISNIKPEGFLKSLLQNFITLHLATEYNFKNGKSYEDYLLLFEKKIKERYEPHFQELVVASHKAKRILRALSFSKKVLAENFSISLSVPCHNDIHPDNLIWNSSRKERPLTFLDWDFSSIGDPFYDLAFAIYRLDLPEDQERFLSENYIQSFVDHYCKSIKKKRFLRCFLETRLLLMKAMPSYWCALYTGMKLMNTSLGEERHEYLLRRLRHHLMNFQISYEQSENFLRVDERASFEEIEEHIRDIQDILKNRNDIYISGSTSITLLDYIFNDFPIDLRDFDVTVIDVQATSLNNCFSFIKKGDFSQKELLYDRPKIRGKPDKNGKADLKEVGHQCIFHNRKGIFNYDITFFESQEASQLNGIFNTDKVMIRVRPQETLQKVVENIKRRGLEKSIRDGVIIDPFEGYKAWLSGNLEVKEKFAIEAFPVDVLFRVLRTYAKQDKDIKPELLSTLKKGLHRKSCRDQDMTKFYSGLFRLLGDWNGFYYVGYLRKIGAFQWIAACHKFDQDIASVFDEKRLLSEGLFPILSTQKRRDRFLNLYASFLKHTSDTHPSINQELKGYIYKIFQHERKENRDYIIENFGKFSDYNVREKSGR